MHGELQVGECVELITGKLAGFGGALATSETATQGKCRVVVPKLGQQFLNFRRELARGADAFECGVGSDVSSLNADELSALELAATGWPFGVDGAGAVARVESWARLIDARATGEKRRVVTRFGANVGKQHAIAAETALQTERVGELGHQLNLGFARNGSGRSLGWRDAKKPGAMALGFELEPKKYQRRERKIRNTYHIINATEANSWSAAPT